MNLNKKKILIISVEGVESNTEVNFFSGFFNHKPNGFDGQCHALGRLSNRSSQKKKYKNRIDSLMQQNQDFLHQAELIYVYIIGDGDSISNIISMERSYDFIKADFTKRKNAKKFIFPSKLIYDENKSFDNILLQNNHIKNSSIFKNNNHKKKTNKGLFNNIINLWHSNQTPSDENIKKILLDIFKNSQYKIIINFIYTN